MRVTNVYRFLAAVPNRDVELQVMQLPETLYQVKEIRQTSSGDVCLVIEPKELVLEGDWPREEPIGAFDAYQRGPITGNKD